MRNAGVQGTGLVGDGDVIGVEQPCAGLALVGVDVNPPQGLQVAVAGGFHHAAVAARACALGIDGAKEAGVVL